MSVCPWCKGQVPNPDLPCPKCGKVAGDLRRTDPPEVARVAAPRIPVPDLAIPDLVLPSAPPSKPRISHKPAPPTGPSPFDDDLGGGGLDLQIDLGAAALVTPGQATPPPQAGGAFNPFDDEDMDRGPALELDVAPAPAPSGGSLPPVSHRSLPPHFSAPPGAPAPDVAPPIAVDPFEVKALADYGPPPNAFWMAPSYSYRVVRRRAELRRAIQTKKIEADAAVRAAEDALVAFAERARPNIESHGGRGLEHIAQAEEVLRSRDGALAGAMDAHKTTLAEIDVRLNMAEADLGKLRAEEQRATDTFTAAEQDKQRAEAKLKRLDIEIRNAPATGTRADERQALHADVAAKEPKLTESAAKLDAARRAAASGQTKATAVRAERTAEEQRFGRQVGTRSEGVEEARTQMRAAFVALGRALVTDKATPELDSARAEVMRLEVAAETKRKALLVHEAAVGAYDTSKVVLGFVLAITAVVLLVVALLFPFIYGALVA